jgi:hypothetical protein
MVVRRRRLRICKRGEVVRCDFLSWSEPDKRSIISEKWEVFRSISTRLVGYLQVIENS